MKSFMKEIIGRFKAKDTVFAVMQYSNLFMLHFDFQKFKRENNPENLVNAIKQRGGQTFTPTGIRKVVREIFIENAGSRTNATKILLVITDGKTYGDKTKLSEVTAEADDKGILRFAIGVGSVFTTHAAKKELHEIASKPASEFVFQVENFSVLGRILDKLQKNIFAIEGTQSMNESSFQLEMSQEGFSSLLVPGAVILGSVGLYDWSGGIFEFQGSQEPTLMNSFPKADMRDAYLGYSVKLAKYGGESLYIGGAPRFQHKGKVIVFKQNSTDQKWQTLQEIPGNQIGSYFGAELCTVDLNANGSTDLLLIGAPLYHGPNIGGLIFICPLSQGLFLCNDQLQGESGHISSRFGAAIAEITDINGDRITDVTVGAPLENNYHGVVIPEFKCEKRAGSS
ncbi:integrin alpha-D-like [Latimeria chalumnae]|uniref:integrin alpha-D-like n=1 Tax=Latimeria chalumnae TaxID=7897 RepID=UPI00313BB644